MNIKLITFILCSLLYGYSPSAEHPRYTPQELRTAIEKADKFKIKAILDIYPEYINTTVNNHTPIFAALSSPSSHHVEILQHLLRWDTINVNHKCFGKTALRQAIDISLFPALTQTLLQDSRTDVNTEDDSGRTPLGTALTYFIYANPNDPLGYTRHSQYNVIVDMLISNRRVNVNKPSVVFYCIEGNSTRDEKMTPLEFSAVNRGHLESTKMLLRHPKINNQVVNWQEQHDKAKRLYGDDDEKCESEHKERMAKFIDLCQSQIEQVEHNQDGVIVDNLDWEMIDSLDVRGVTQGVADMTLDDDEND